MSGCDGMDMEASSLCHAHAQSADQSIDKPPAPKVAGFFAISVIVIPLAEPLAQPKLVASGVGFIALAGVAVEFGVIRFS